MVDAPAPETNENTNSPGDTGGICFPGDATVVLQSGTTIKIRDLKVRGLWNAREAGTVHI